MYVASVLRAVLTSILLMGQKEGHNTNTREAKRKYMARQRRNSGRSRNGIAWSVRECEGHDDSTGGVRREQEKHFLEEGSGE